MILNSKPDQHSTSPVTKQNLTKLQVAKPCHAYFYADHWCN